MIGEVVRADRKQELLRANLLLDVLWESNKVFHVHILDLLTVEKSPIVIGERVSIDNNHVQQQQLSLLDVLDDFFSLNLVQQMKKPCVKMSRTAIGVNV